MQDLDPPAIPFLFKLDTELRKSKFTVWRNISWHDGSEIPIFAFKNCWFVSQFSISLFLKDTDRVSVNDLNLLTEACLQYLERPRSKSTKAPWSTPYLIILILVSEHLAQEAIDFVCKNDAIKKHNIFWKEVSVCPVLINSNIDQIYYSQKKQLFGGALYHWLFKNLVERLIVQNL